ncbi:phage tail protein [Micromonospora sp. CA-111912]|uniref:phage tail protein n=1 Tax=Micromonospora sp. CA-111912 TaxID=3239955 RepID=UPI003D8EE7DA
MSPAVAQRLQATAGNRAVSALVAQRRAAGSAARRSPTTARSTFGGRASKTGSTSSCSSATVQPTTAPATGGAGPEVVDPSVHVPVQRLATDAGPVHRPGPQADPKFAALKADVRGKQQVLGAHPPATSEASKAQGAAKAPQDDKEAQGKAANAEKMNAAKPGEFDKAAFVRSVNEAIAAQAPKNLDEADKFGDSGKADAVKGQVQGQVTDGKKASANTIETTTKAPPDTSQAVDKPVTPLVADKPPATPGMPDPAKAVPDKAPPAATDLSGGPKQVDQQMADAQVTEEQLAKSNEPEFTGALKEKDAVEQHAATAPGQMRAAEAQTLTGAKAAAGAAGATAMTALTGDRKQAGQAVGAGKEQAKSADEVKRAQVTATLQKVFDATKKDVEEILSSLDKKVDEKFSAGEKAARDAFTAEHTRLMDAYKDKRYSGLLGKGRWIKDKFAGLPEEANQIFATARKGYVDRMQQVISGVADVIGAELTRAKQRIATGRTELQAAVKGLAPELQAIGKEAAGEFAGKFDELTESVNNKGTELVQTLASKYNEALKSVDEEIAAEKEKNKGLVAKAVDAVAGVIKTIMQLKDMLMGVLAKAAQAVMAIIKDPIGFLGNLVSAVGAGLRGFLANIGEHLKKGLVGWLTGAMAGAGLELPAKFDLRGIVMMVGSLLGLTWASIRGLIIQRGVPEPAMGAVEKSVPLVQKVQAQGLGGLWEEIQDKVGDLKANLFSKISEYLIPTVLMAGITWIISLLNPASAFVRAVKMIIDFVTFIVTQGAQILEFVNSVLDAIIAIAGGGTGGVPALIEKALARSVPVLIGVLAAVLGVGGIAQKVQKFFKSLSAPVRKAVHWVVDKIAALGKKIWAKLKAKGQKLKGRLSRNKTPEQKRHLLDQGMAAGVRAVNKYAGKPVKSSLIKPLLSAIRLRYGLSSLHAEKTGEHWSVTGKINPEQTKPTEALTGSEVRGAVAAYRGIHFKRTWDPDTYDRTLQQKLVGKPEFSAAAREIAGSRTPDGSDVPEKDLTAAAELVQETVKKTKDPQAVRQWWGSRKQQFDNLYLALLQRYINTYNAFEKELKDPSTKPGGMGFTTIPFMSTSKKAEHSAAYAKGEKFIDDKDKRTVGVVGRVFVYVFSLRQLQQQDPANVQELQNGGKVKIGPRIIHEGEVTFTGHIPGENRVAEVDAGEADSVSGVADKARAAADSHGAAEGGIREWTS